MSHELFKKYRPKVFEDVVGQNEIIKQLKKMMKEDSVPHAILFSGQTGCGKTSVSRILAKELNCHRDDLNEINIADSRGIDTIRTINETMSLYPMNGKVKVYLLDEAGELNNFAQKALLKSLEDTPNHVFFMLATTNPEKLIPTVRNRCSKFEVKPLSYGNMKLLLDRILYQEDCTHPEEEVIDSIIEHANGSAREALVTLEQVIKLEEKEEQLEAITKISAEGHSNAFELVKALLWNKASWTTVAKLVKTLDVNEIEGIRKLILKNCENELLKSGNSMSRAILIIDSFEKDFFSSGMAGFSRACFEVAYQK